VRLRTNSSFGGAAESIGPRKRARIVAAGWHYLAGKPELPCRYGAARAARAPAYRMDP